MKKISLVCIATFMLFSHGFATSTRVVAEDARPVVVDAANCAEQEVKKAVRDEGCVNRLACSLRNTAATIHKKLDCRNAAQPGEKSSFLAERARGVAAEMELVGKELERVHTHSKQKLAGYRQSFNTYANDTTEKIKRGYASLFEAENAEKESGGEQK